MCKITFSIENNRDLLMTVIPTSCSSTINIKNMHNAFTSSAYAKYVLIDDAIERLLEDINSELGKSKPVDKVNCSKIIANAIDAALSVSVDTDDMSATLELVTAQGGQPINYGDVLRYLKKNGIVKGVNKEKVNNIVANGLSAPAGNTISVEIALGRGCKNGDDGYIKYLVEDPINKILRPKKIANGKVDMRDLGGVIHLTKGTKLATLVPPTTGVNGFTVKGKIIEATAGEDYFIEESEGSSFLDEKKTVLVANISGMPKHIERSISVNKLLQAENIDVSTGNIEFDGSIFVKGNVCERMKLCATGDIIICGLVESATIKADGDICINQGIIGRQIEDEYGKTEYTTFIQAKGNVSAQFVQYANMVSQSNITINQYLSHSQVIVEGELWLGNKDKAKADGKLFGSNVQSGSSIFIGVLGSPSGDTTSINFNYWSNKLANLRQSTRQKSEELTKKNNDISKLIKKFNSNDDNNKNQELCQRLENTLKQHLALLVSCNKDMLEKEAKALTHLNELSISAYEAMFPGVDITIGDQTHCLKRDHGATCVNWTNKKIMLEPITTRVDN